MQTLEREDTVAEIEKSIVDFMKIQFGPASSSMDGATPLLSNAILDSLGVLQLMMFLSERFDFEVADSDFEPENFETIGHLAAFVSSKKTS